MTNTAARKLKVGDRVRWTEDGALGTVREKGYAAVKVQWDDDQWLLLYVENNEPMLGKIESAA